MLWATGDFMSWNPTFTFSNISMLRCRAVSQLVLLKRTNGGKNSHPQWQTRTEKVLKTIKQLPQDRLKECFGDEYDGVMDLKMVKIMDHAIIDDAVQSDKEGEGNSKLASSVPQKRGRENSE